MDDRVYLIWLTLKDIKHDLTVTLLSYYGSPMAVYNESKYAEFNLSDTILALLNDKSLDEAYNAIEKTRDAGAYIVTIYDSYYPNLLKHIYDPPYVLYAKGQWPYWDELLTITLVGTRELSGSGKRAAEHITAALALKGVATVSGLARGIDSVVAETSVKEGGFTIAVLGCGIDVVYPPENRYLFSAIERSGLILTEYPPGTKPLKHHFPTRNRIMAGLSYGTVVIEAPLQSGSLITAANALENNRNVYAVPGDIFKRSFKGSNTLLKNGAKAVSCAEDILEDYPYFEFEVRKDSDASSDNNDNMSDASLQKDKAAIPSHINLDSLSEESQAIIKLLCEEDMHIDEITRRLELSSDKIGSELIMLEIEGIVTRLTDNKYSILQ